MTINENLEHAVQHIQSWMAEGREGGDHITHDGQPQEAHLNHAFTRLMMACLINLHADTGEGRFPDGPVDEWTQQDIIDAREALKVAYSTYLNILRYYQGIVDGITDEIMNTYALELECGDGEDVAGSAGNAGIDIAEGGDSDGGEE